MLDPWPTRVIGALVGVFYLVVGGWAFLGPTSFFSTVATFAPLNIHLLHDAGAFQVGLGLALTLPVVMRVPLRAPLVAVLGGSILHVIAHIEDIHLGGHPTTDLLVLTVICIGLAIALTVDLRAHRA